MTYCIAAYSQLQDYAFNNPTEANKAAQTARLLLQEGEKQVQYV
jgi:hypothetical protein